MAAARGAHVLVVDDDLNIRMFLEDALLEEGYPVATAEDGAAALAALADPPALVVTALPPAHAAAALADCPHDRELRKPFDLADLFAAVAALYPGPG